MRFRWKLTILLVLIAIVPMMTMRFIGQRGVRALGTELVSRSREGLNVNMRERLKLVVESYSRGLFQKRETLAIALAYQAGEIERYLARKSPQPASIYFAADFDTGRNLPEDLAASADHDRFIAENKMKSLQVTYSAQVFNLVSGIHPAAVKDDVERLAQLTPLYLRFSRYLKGLVIWHYTVLDNGLYTAYPGHGDFPAGYDPRQQPWYLEALNLDSFWTDQFVDAVTGQRVIAVSRPIHGPDGKITGVTALIVPIRNLMEHRQLLKYISDQTRSYVVSLATRPGTGQSGIRVIAREDADDNAPGGWRTSFQADWLAGDDAQDAQYQAMLEDLEKGNGNIRRIRYRGCDCLWMYRPIHQQSYLVLITPYDQIIQPALKVEDYIQSQIQELLTITSYTIAGIFVIVFILALAFSRSVTRPLQILADGARRLAQGRLDARVDIRARDEFGDMARVFNSVGPRLEEHYQLLKSLDLAMEVQQNLLPRVDPLVKGLDIAGKSDYCEETGGDYYDYLGLEKDKISVVVGDVSGHGISSALLMTTARALLRQRTAMAGSIPEIVSDVNRRLSEDTEESGQFMTLFYGTINLHETKISWVRAGHDAAFIYDSRLDTFAELSGGGLPLGVTGDAVYEQLQLTIAPGQIIAIGTDGIWETQNQQGAMFGKTRLQEIIRGAAQKTAREIIDAATAALDDFRYPENKKSDDITLVVIKVKETAP